MFSLFFPLENNENVFALNDKNIIYIEKAIDLFKLEEVLVEAKTFQLKNDIDFNIDVSWYSKVVDHNNGWMPLNTYGINGTFDGGGYVIKNLKIDRNIEYSGFFSKNSLNVKNLFFEESSVLGGDSLGVLAGLNNGKIDNVHAKGVVTANNTGSGIIAENYGGIDNCSFEGDVTGRLAAGLVGLNNSSIIANSYSIGSVSGQKIGGLISTAYRSNSSFTKIQNSFSFCSLVEIEYDLTAKRVGGADCNKRKRNLC